ncbi:hypothetical protein ACIU1J_05390 [Azospirillum doebereinerae]|uniref:hypothetical protein n=1 Tax=Azospirillum doebereinerae TaxID=92933 RepID=UPI001EE538BB|nr:hypothetical protein [Azospirillum doebereinerae]MCG5240850.1 hypothetical protein [Azospirillum doebereinerae]
MIPPADRWGPFVPDLPDIERAARCRALGALVRVFTGPKGEQVVAALRRLEANANDAPAALAALEQLPALSRRKALASFTALHRPRTP